MAAATFFLAWTDRVTIAFVAALRAFGRTVGVSRLQFLDKAGKDGGMLVFSFAFNHRSFLFLLRWSTYEMPLVRLTTLTIPQCCSLFLARPE